MLGTKWRVVFSHHISIQPFTSGFVQYVELANLFGGQEGSVCDLSHALGPVLEREEPRGSASGHYQHFWAHHFLDLTEALLDVV